MGDGWRARLRGRRDLVNLVVAVGQPLLVVGAAVVGARLGAYPAGAGAAAVPAVLVPVVGVLWVAGVALDAHPVALVLGGIAGAVAVVAVLNGTQAAALHERGERASCEVAAVSERIVRSAHVRSDTGDAPAQWPNPPFPPPQPPVPGPGFDPIDDVDHDTTTTWYDYRLSCDRGPSAPSAGPRGRPSRGTAWRSCTTRCRSSARSRPLTTPTPTAASRESSRWPRPGS
jgi:hypothetical protein